jgi:predicted TIM-barrel fold metal-dependent hydrolase
MPDQPVIYNCHIHLFTIDDVPDRFLPMGLPTLMRFRPFRSSLVWLMRRVNPFEARDLVERYANFVQVSYTAGREEGILARVRGYYPSDTRFVVLPMDMAWMEAGKVRRPYREQLQTLAKLRDEHPEQVLPFITVDPRREGVLELVQEFVEVHRFRGVKLYPSLGFFPFDPALYPVYVYAQAHDLPVLVHCSRGGVYKRRVTPEDPAHHPKTGQPLDRSHPKHYSGHYADPDNYVEVLRDFPNLRLCMAHFGGDAEWQRWLRDEWRADSPPAAKSWLAKILDLIRSGDYPNLYTDISYTIFQIDDHLPILKVLLENQQVRERVLFGSDYYMVEQEALPERQLALRIRAALGEDRFWQIAWHNPRRFLGE